MAQFCLPHNLLVFSFPRLNLQALVVHLVHVAGSLHVAQDVVLQLRHRLQRVGDVLVLLDVADHLGRLCTLGKVDEVGLLDNRRDAVLDEGKIRQVYACGTPVNLNSIWTLQVRKRREVTYQRRECTGDSRRAELLGTRQSSWC